MPATAARIEPEELTFKSELAGMFVIASEVVVAFVANKFPAVSAVVDAYGNCEAATVDDEKKTP